MYSNASLLHIPHMQLTDFCYKCNELFPLSVMREHTQVCTMHMTTEKEDTAVIDLTATTTHLESDDEEEHVYDTEVVSPKLIIIIQQSDHFDFYC